MSRPCSKAAAAAMMSGALKSEDIPEGSTRMPLVGHHGLGERRNRPLLSPPLRPPALEPPYYHKSRRAWRGPATVSMAPARMRCADPVSHLEPVAQKSAGHGLVCDRLCYFPAQPANGPQHVTH